MKTVIHRKDERGTAEHGWLHARHSFSFASYYNPEKMGFGKLRVLNDDIIEPASGFGTHPHENMEIVTIMLSGELHHADNMNNSYTIQQNEVQIMSAGTGIAHSEINQSNNESVNLLQIWVLPKTQNIKPRYAQDKFPPENRRNRFATIISPENEGEKMWINQDAWFSLGDFDADRLFEHSLHMEENGAYIFVISGQIKIGDDTLRERDAIGITDTDGISIQTESPSQLLIIEVPMK